MRMEKADNSIPGNSNSDDFWDFMPPLAATLAGIAVLAVIFFLIIYCVCKKEAYEPLVRRESESDNKEWTTQKNMAYEKDQSGRLDVKFI